jgi:hypothetical protein
MLEHDPMPSHALETKPSANHTSPPWKDSPDIKGVNYLRYPFPQEGYCPPFQLSVGIALFIVNSCLVILPDKSEIVVEIQSLCSEMHHLLPGNFQQRE